TGAGHADLLDRAARRGPAPAAAAAGRDRPRLRAACSASRTERRRPPGRPGMDQPTVRRRSGPGTASSRDRARLGRRRAVRRPARRRSGRAGVAAVERRTRPPDGGPAVSAPSPFDITGPLPTGTTLLEASAGTGKTWTIGALVTRYVAEGVVTLPELLVITFGRAASREMRERVRDHLVAAEAALADPDTASDGDPVVRSLVSVPDEERTRRLARVRTALTDFDGAT